uniref:Cystinosin n=1 Tax=Trichobilharzia regenti TaxID=157069 RepID=A0AA85J5L0_TRIRE|nr:unnamed protein product [Trichobilharzia regenti]
MLSRVLAIFCFLYSFGRNVRSDDSYEVYFEPKSVFMEVGESEVIKVGLNHSVDYYTEFHLTQWDRNGREIILEDSNHAVVDFISDFSIEGDNIKPAFINIWAKSSGKVYLKIKTKDDLKIINMNTTQCEVTVVRNRWVYMLQIISGWLYFGAWTISFYPQFLLNWKRKSVVGFNFDFAVLNVIGFLYYSIYNIGLFWIPLIQKQYFGKYPFSSLPVLLNDVVFSFHALIISSMTALQILFFERGGQRVSNMCKGLIVLIGIYTIVICILGGVKVVLWLEAFYLLSHVKLFISFVKYTPQAVMNFRRKSTVGWSIGNIILDFSGGVFSIAQMLLIAYNERSIGGIIGSPVKLGLGILSIGFDILFMIQHWCLYRSSSNDNKF